MNGILIEPKNLEELKMKHNLLDIKGIKHSEFNIEDLEDLALSLLMHEEDEGEVSRVEIFKLLES